MPEVIILLKDITKRYKDFSLYNITLSVEKGETLLLVGSNGAGKSTLIDIIAGVVNYDKGSLNIFGKELSKLSDAERQKIGMIRDEILFPEDLRVGLFLKSVALLYKNWNSQKMEELLKKFNIDRTKKIKNLSKGMKMKLWVVIALSHAAEIMLLDEPFLGLDVTSKKDFIEILKQLKINKSTIILSTHEYDNVENLCDRILFLVNGKVYYNGELKDFLSTWTRVEFYDKKPPLPKLAIFKESKEDNRTILLINKNIDIVKNNFDFLNEDVLISKMTLKEIITNISAG